MPAERCPRCGTARTAGRCACGAPSATEQTALLPPLDGGPPLVRPYVAVTPVVEAADSSVDPFATRIAPAVHPITAPPVQPIVAAPQAPSRPPVQPLVNSPAPQAPAPPVQQVPPRPMAPPPPPAQPPAVPQAASPFGPPPAQSAPAAAETQLLPPVSGRFVPTPPPEAPTQLALGRVTPTQLPPQFSPQVPPQFPAQVSPQAGPPPLEVQPPGAAEATQLITLDGAEEWSAQRGEDLGMFTFRDESATAALSRSERRELRQQSADRRRLVIAGGAVGLAALGASLAMLLSSSPAPVDNALPAPTGPAPTSPADPSPSQAPSSESAASPSASSASPSRTSARPTQATTKAAAPPAQTSAAPPSSAAPSSAAPSSSAPPAVLKRGDSGPEVVKMQRLLMAAYCNNIGPLDSEPNFGYWTESTLARFQRSHKIKGEDNVYGPNTRIALEAAAANPDC
ncbi:peptidoglycan-binding protein [Kitasatospora sp. NPDC049285]|uniref:peptidoglycan-binding domain-containing protein n=1 Tax=Kitasatospora sp. NPDC049285 TaxID=3157096 RepID=UPI00342D8978